MSAKYYEIGYMGQLAISIMLLFLSLKYLKLQWVVIEWSLCITLLVNSTAIYIGFTAIPNILAFRLGNTDKLTSIFRWSFKKVTQYPIKSMLITPIMDKK